MMWKYFILFLSCASLSVICQVVSNVRLLNHQSYFIELMQATVNHIEEEIYWCNFKIPEFNQTINQHIYGWDIQGTVFYKNGFIRSIKEIDVWDQTVQQLWTHNTETNISTATVRGSLRLHEVELAFDVELVLDSGETFFYTTTFTHELIRYPMAVNRNMQENTLTASATIDNLSGGTNRARMVYHPSNNITEVLQRAYVPSRPYDNVADWGRDIFQPIILELATTKIQFPHICYDCAV